MVPDRLETVQQCRKSKPQKNKDKEKFLIIRRRTWDVMFTGQPGRQKNKTIFSSSLFL